MKNDDAGIYECLLITDYGQANAYFELNMPKLNHPSSDDRSHYKLDKLMIHNPTPIIMNENRLNKDSIRFSFVEYDLRPYGQVVVMCETDLPQAINNWIKIDKVKKSNAVLDGDRLVIYRLNKYDLNNFACESREGTRRVERPLELDANEYYRQMESFYMYTRNLNIILMTEKSDLRMGGHLALKCTDEINFERKRWLTNNLDRSRVHISNDDLIEIKPLEKYDANTIVSCLFIDEFGEKKLDFLIEPKYLVESTTLKTEKILTTKKNNFIKIHHHKTTKIIPTTTFRTTITSTAIIPKLPYTSHYATNHIKDLAFDHHPSINDSNKLQANDLNIKFNLIQPNHRQGIQINERVIIDCIASGYSYYF